MTIGFSEAVGGHRVQSAINGRSENRSIAADQYKARSKPAIQSAPLISLVWTSAKQLRPFEIELALSFTVRLLHMFLYLSLLDRSFLY